MQSFNDTDCVPSTNRTATVLTVFRQRDLFLAFCILL